MSSVSESPAPVCGFCGRGPDDVGRLIQGLTAWICDGCVAFCHGILQQVGPRAGERPAAESTIPDPVMAGLAEASALATTGDRAAARARYEEIWAGLGPDGDPLHSPAAFQVARQPGVSLESRGSRTVRRQRR